MGRQRVIYTVSAYPARTFMGSIIAASSDPDEAVRNRIAANHGVRPNTVEIDDRVDLPATPPIQEAA